MLDEFLEIFRAARSYRLGIIDMLLPRALLDGDAAAAEELKAERRRLLDFPAAVAAAPTISRESLAAMWPPNFGELPLSFTDPARAAELDPPGKPCVVDLKALETIDKAPDFDIAAIIARRQEKAVEEAERDKRLKEEPQTPPRLSRPRMSRRDRG